ncbi:hypothetical protein Celaphus_00015686 [Cervus elaphus hippelaphus]|uniref:Uncharacterized protein n=1 Tax=Cervus elaphus hippelaphus TaxID=46360 RepID=A0A212C2L3_CEREH|nr:hypothetical protein Celaphus_00015686 [Cervus elaphus hippelaphus]
MVTVLPKKDSCSFPKEVHITAIKTENNCIRRRLGKYILQRPVPVQQSPVPACLIHTKALRKGEINKQTNNQLKLGPTLTKELTFSSNKLDNVIWIQRVNRFKKKYKVQITIPKGNKAGHNRILQTMSETVTFSSRHQPIRGDKGVMCVLGLLSEKEENAWRATQDTQRRDTVSRENGKDGASDVLHQ